MAACHPSSDQLPDAGQSGSTTGVSSSASTMTEDRLLEKAVDEWHQLCQRLQHSQSVLGSQHSPNRRIAVVDPHA